MRATRAMVLALMAVLGTFLAIAVATSGDDGGDDVSLSGYQPFVVGERDDLAASIVDDGPIGFTDPERGDRSFYLDLHGADLVALHAVLPGSPPDDPCLVQLDSDRRGFVDCDGAAVDPTTLNRFAVVTASDGETVAVDLRELLAPPAG